MTTTTTPTSADWRRIARILDQLTNEPAAAPLAVSARRRAETCDRRDLDTASEHHVAAAVIAAAAGAAGCSIGELTGSPRDRHIVAWRHAAMYLLNTRHGMSTPRIGDQFDYRDHTSVMYAVRKVRKALNGDDAPEWCARLDLLIDESGIDP